MNESAMSMTSSVYGSTSAVLFHFHGIGTIDFSILPKVNLSEVQQLAIAQQVEVVPTVYLQQDGLNLFERLLAEYADRRMDGDLSNIIGFAIEGPILGPVGGVPHSARWLPSAAEWRRIAALGNQGLRYVVMAPDSVALTEEIADGMSLERLLIEMYDSGVRAALGHFRRDDQVHSARRTGEVIEFLHRRYASSRELILSDHLYNDMPRSFRHAWRTAEEQAIRDTEVKSFLDHPWNRDNLETLLGPVPAVMLNAARDDLIFPCLNFDGFHVDLEIARRTVEYLGTTRVIALTDHTDVATLSDEKLTMDSDTRLWMRSDGVVAAGSIGHLKQIDNMRQLGFDNTAIRTMFLDNPRAAIGFLP